MAVNEQDNAEDDDKEETDDDDEGACQDHILTHASHMVGKDVKWYAHDSDTDSDNGSWLMTNDS